MREIEYDKPCFIIAEAGINHNGSLEIAKQMADAAKLTGADAVKYQTFLPEELGNKYPNITYEETVLLKEYCDSIGILFLSTPHSYSAIDLLYKLVPIYKIASPRLYDWNFVRAVLNTGQPAIISVDRKARHRDIDWLLDREVMFMHTVCKYPAPDPDFVTLAIRMAFYNQKVWGYSDHCGGDRDCCVQAVEDYGVAAIEKHMKIVEKCPDAEHSIYPQEFKTMVERIRRVETTSSETFASN